MKRNNNKSSSLYFSPTYDIKQRFVSYWHQINEIISFRPNSILEIGIGSKFTSTYLRQRGYTVITLDIDPFLDPDVVGSVTNIPFADGTFDVVACFEVLEHIPYSKFITSLKEIHRVAKRFAIISLPDVTPTCRLFIDIPIIGELRVFAQLPRLNIKTKPSDEQHYWEIGIHKQYELHKIIDDIAEAGFTLIKTYRVFEFPYHRFFILKKVE